MSVMISAIDRLKDKGTRLWKLEARLVMKVENVMFLRKVDHQQVRILVFEIPVVDTDTLLEKRCG